MLKKKRYDYDCLITWSLSKLINCLAHISVSAQRYLCNHGEQSLAVSRAALNHDLLLSKLFLCLDRFQSGLSQVRPNWSTTTSPVSSRPPRWSRHTCDATGVLKLQHGDCSCLSWRRGRTKCCSWWRRQRYCFINSPSTSNLQRAARWLNTETTHIKPACSTSWLNRRKRRRSHANNPPHKKYIRAESRRRGREAHLYQKITDLWRETLKEDI